jgi:pentatricopeptide repeat protein
MDKQRQLEEDGHGRDTGCSSRLEMHHRVSQISGSATPNSGNQFGSRQQATQRPMRQHNQQSQQQHPRRRRRPPTPFDPDAIVSNNTNTGIPASSSAAQGTSSGDSTARRGDHPSGSGTGSSTSRGLRSRNPQSSSHRGPNPPPPNTNRSVPAGSSPGNSVRDFNRRISAFARRRDLHGALQTLAALDVTPGLERNLFTYNAIINALVMCAQYTRAELMWSDMIAAGISPNLVTYNTMLKSFFSGSDADVDRAFALVAEMESNNIAADRVTLNSLINSCVAAGRVDDARRVYEQMQQRLIDPDDFTFTTLAKGGASQNNVKMLDALLVHQLRHHAHIRKRADSSRGTRGHQTRSHEANSASGNFAHDDMSVNGTNKQRTSRACTKGNGNYSRVSTDSWKGGSTYGSNETSPVAYNAIADAYIRCGHPTRALELLGRMSGPGTRAVDKLSPMEAIPVAPDVQTFNVKLKALRESGAPTSEAFSALKEMGRLRLEADHITLLTLADLCCRRGEMHLAEGVLLLAVDEDVREAERGSSEWTALGNLQGNRSPSKQSPAPFGSTSRHTRDRKYNGQPRNAKANASLFNALIRGYSAVEPPDIGKVMSLYGEMKRHVEVYNFSFYAPDAVTYTMLVDVFARVGDANQAESIICEMEASGLSSTSVVAYNAFLKANRGNGIQKAFEVLERIKERGLKPDVVTYNTMCDLLSAEENGVRLAEELVKEMSKYNVKPDLLTFNTLLKGAARSKGHNNNPREALNMAYFWLAELQRCGFRPDEFTYQSMVSACAAAGDAPRALEFFRRVEAERAKRMSSAGVGSKNSSYMGVKHGGSFSWLDRHVPDYDSPQSSSPGQSSEQVPRSAFLNDNLVDLGTQFSLDAMSSTERAISGLPEANVPISTGDSNEYMLLAAHPAAYIALMRAFLSSGREDGVDCVLKLRDEMKERGLELGRSGYTAVADAYADRGDIAEVDNTFREMLSHQLDAHSPAIGTIQHSIRIKALCHANRLDEAIQVLREVVDPDAAVFNTLIFACAKTKDRHRMITVLRAMESAGVEPDAITARALDGLLRSLANALRTFDERFRNGIVKFISTNTTDISGLDSE